MSILKYLVKPSARDETNFYILKQLLESKGLNKPYMLTNCSNGFYNLIRKSGWRHEHIEKTKKILLFPQLGVRPEEIECTDENLSNLYQEFKLKRKDES